MQREPGKGFFAADDAEEKLVALAGNVGMLGKGEVVTGARVFPASRRELGFLFFSL
jgi:hypothetical protein